MIDIPLRMDAQRHSYFPICRKGFKLWILVGACASDQKRVALYLSILIVFTCLIVQNIAVLVFLGQKKPRKMNGEVPECRFCTHR